MSATGKLTCFFALSAGTFCFLLSPSFTSTTRLLKTKLWNTSHRTVPALLYTFLRPDTPAYFLNARDVRKERALLSAFESTKALRKTASKASLALKEEKRAEEEEARKALPRKNRSGSQTSELEDGTADGYEHGAVLGSRTVRSRKSIQGRGGSGGGGSGRDREGSSSSGGGGGNATMTTLPGAVDDGNHSDASSEGRVVLDD